MAYDQFSALMAILTLLFLPIGALFTVGFRLIYLNGWLYGWLLWIWLPIVLYLFLTLIGLGTHISRCNEVSSLFSSLEATVDEHQSE